MVARRAISDPAKREIKRLIEEAIVDCYDELEQTFGLFTKLEEHLA